MLRITLILLFLYLSCHGISADENSDIFEEDSVPREKRNGILQLKANLFDRVYNQARTRGVGLINGVGGLASGLNLAGSSGGGSVSLLNSLGGSSAGLNALRSAGGGALSLFNGLGTSSITSSLPTGGGALSLINGLTGPAISSAGSTGDLGVSLISGLGGLTSGLNVLSSAGSGAGSALEGGIRSGFDGVLTQLAGGTGDGVLSLLRRKVDSVRGLSRGGGGSLLGLFSSGTPGTSLRNIGISTVDQGISSLTNNLPQIAVGGGGSYLRNLVPNVGTVIQQGGDTIRSLIPSYGGSVVASSVNLPQPTQVVQQGVDTIRSLVPGYASGVATTALNTLGSGVLGQGVGGGVQTLRNLASTQLSQGAGSVTALTNRVQGLLNNYG